MWTLSAIKYVCIHGHFYQPARENPFTDRVEEESTAAPYANWNERITSECYAPNLSARILGPDGEPRRLINTFEWISFDLGPTILEWMKWNDNDVYKGLVNADAASVKRFGGHGSAMAQSYNHTILPLSNTRDRRTQVRWGVKDFEHRFGRMPEGMWLPETAVDLETLTILAEEGIRFTVLSPYQAAEVLGEDGEWIDVRGGGIDTRVPYRVGLPGGREIAVFFYDGPLSMEIAFNGILDDGHLLADALIQGLGEDASSPVMANVATDGESYGHHHKFGEMALAVAIEDIDNHPDVRLTNYAGFLANHPPTREARVIENSSWSCFHGVERWRSDCGCSSGLQPTADQEWRAPLRDALNWLRDQLAPRFEALRGDLFIDPWEARDDYVDVLLGTPAEEFFKRHTPYSLSIDDQERAVGHLRIQQHLMLMYTSCGWFFDDLGRLETAIVLKQAARAIDLAKSVVGVDLEAEFLNRAASARSNLDGRNAAEIYLGEVAPYRSALSSGP